MSISKKGVTPRDFEVLKLLFYIRYSDTDIIAETFYKWNGQKINKQYKTIARRHLKKLREDLKLIKSYIDTEHGPAFHTLTSKGALYIGQTLDIETTWWKEPKGFISRSLARHSLQLGQLYSDILRWELEGRYKIKELRLERENRQEILIGNEKAVLQPDMYVELRKNGKDHSFFIELDNNTERKDKLQEKISRYERFYRRHNRKDVLVFYCDTLERVKQLREVVTRLPVEYRIKGEPLI